MPFEPDEYLSRHFKTSGADLSRKLDELVALVAPDDSPNLPLYREMLLTVIRMAQADRSRWDARSCCRRCARWSPPSAAWSPSSGGARSPCSAPPERPSSTRCTPRPGSSARPWRATT